MFQIRKIESLREHNDIDIETRSSNVNSEGTSINGERKTERSYLQGVFVIQIIIDHLTSDESFSDSFHPYPIYFEFYILFGNHSTLCGADHCGFQIQVSILHFSACNCYRQERRQCP